ncbi:glycosyltransferase family 2 protein [Candidatus Saccharibacteria bacterium]|nr:glycosyltransferase family 2 protein [Candidatus Saccharibacteria bacterium]
MSRMAVLLATYNGALFLESLLDSVLSQTVQPTIIVRDDGSDDNTPKILSSHADQLVLLNDRLGNVGIVNNFNILAKLTNAPYVAFADQDDIWEANKLAVQMELMFRMENQYGTDMPILIHSDLAVCDSNLQTVAPSLWRYQRLNPNVQSFSRLLVQNNVTGCTMLINKALKDLAFPVPQGAVMHDWWLALVAAAVGKIGFVSHPLVRYRQHGCNQLGAVRSDWTGIVQRATLVNPHHSLRAAQIQAGAFYRRYAGRRMGAAASVAEIYANITRERYLKRLWQLAKHDFWKQDLWRNLGLILFI